MSSQRFSHGDLASTGTDFVSLGPHFSNSLQTHGATFLNYEQNLNRQIGSNPAYLSVGHGNLGMDYRSEGPRISHGNMAAGSFPRESVGSHYYSTTAADYGTQELAPGSGHYPANQAHTMTRHSTITTSSLPTYSSAVTANTSTQPPGNSMVNVTGAGYYSASSSHSRAYSQSESHSKKSLSESHRRYR